MSTVLSLIQSLDPNFRPKESKVHFARHNGWEHPQDVYIEGNFEEWQSWQSRLDFSRRQVLSFVQLKNRKDMWLFVGLFDSVGVREADPAELQRYQYDLAKTKTLTELEGRLVISFSAPRPLAQLGENCIPKFGLEQILAMPLTIEEFPGYKYVDIAKAQLDYIVKHGVQSWRTALSNVAGVYLITESASGQLYVGCAYGEQGIWQRWSEYARTGHGGNIELQALVEQSDKEQAPQFRYSMLEVMDLNSTQKEVQNREQHWMRILSSRNHGLNN